MTRAELRTLVLSWLDDPNGGFFTQPQVNVFLNNAQKEVQKRLIKAGQNYYFRCKQTTMVVNQNDYVLPSDFKKMHRFEIIISGVAPNESKQIILPITPNQQDLVQTGSGTPRYYFIKKNRVHILPAADTPITLRITYSYEVADMTLDSDEPDAPDAYHELVALLAAEDGFIKDGRASDLLEKKIMVYQKDMDADAADRLQDLPRSITETGNDSNSGFFW